MVVVLPESVYDEWLVATAERSGQFLVPVAAEKLKVGSERD